MRFTTEFGLAVIIFISICVLNVDGDPVCTKIDQCSCRVSGAEPSGVINLHDIVSGKREPEFRVEGKSQQTNLVYNFSYNPCYTFSDYGCPNTGLCQTRDGMQPQSLGDLETSEFLYAGDPDHTVLAFYISGNKTTEGRASTVGLVCDETETKGRFVFNQEVYTNLFAFLLYT